MKIDTIMLIAYGNQMSTTLPVITKKHKTQPCFVYCGLIAAVDQTFLAKCFVVLKYSNTCMWPSYFNYRAM